MALNQWHLTDGSFFSYATDVRPVVWSRTPWDWLGRFFKPNQSTSSILHLAMHSEGCFSGWMWSDQITTVIISCSSPPEVSLLSIFFGRAQWFFIWQRKSGSSQDVSEVIVLCCIRYKPTHRGSWSMNCICEAENSHLSLREQSLLPPSAASPPALLCRCSWKGRIWPCSCVPILSSTWYLCSISVCFPPVSKSTSLDI